MRINSDFRGRVIQVVESLDFGDAVSNQIVALDSVLRELGLKVAIHSQWAHPKVEALRSHLSDLNVGDEDIILLHFAGFSEYAFPAVRRLRCTKICVYHNITPDKYFESGSPLHDLCFKGRAQLKEVVRDCHWFWGDSQYNLDEIIGLGVSRSKCIVVPIIVDDKSKPPPDLANLRREVGSWIFLGRVAASKGQLHLIQVFARARKISPDCAKKLFLVGNYDETSSYVKALKDEILALDLGDHVVLTGKVSDEEVDQYLQRSHLYVSMSEHEGFGVPLIEAGYYGLPVVALSNSAVPETLGSSGILGDSSEDILQRIVDVFIEPEYLNRVVQAQLENAKRFTKTAVGCQLQAALMRVLPGKHQFVSVSIVISTLNRSELLRRCLDYLQFQTNQSFEVIVVNGPSSDDTDEVLKEVGSRIKVARNAERNLAMSRNIGIELAAGDLIAFIDDDALPFDDWIDTLISEFSVRPLTHAAIGGPAYFAGTLQFQAQDIGVNRFAQDRQNIEKHEIGVDGWERSMLGTNACYRADIIRQLCGFDEEFDYYLDESELSFRLQKNNYIVGYCPSLYLRHEFAQGDNRRGQYRYNWYSICKNTAYFIAAYSGLVGEELERYIDNRISSERVLPLDNALEAGDISEAEHSEFVQRIEAGVKQGLTDARESFPKVRKLVNKGDSMVPFTLPARYPLIGRDIRRLHICIVTKEFPPFLAGGGIGTLYYHLVSELLLMGHWLTVVIPGDYPNQQRTGRFCLYYQPIHYPVTDRKNAIGFQNNCNWSISAMHAVTQVHAHREIDVIDSALWDSEALALSLIPATERPPLVLRLVTPFRVASKINGWNISQRESGLYEAAERSVIAHADAIVPISESIASTIESEYGIRRDMRWQVSHCGIAYWPSFDVRTNYSDLSSIGDPQFSKLPGKKLILFIGRLERRKGIDLLMSAAPEILSSDPDAFLMFAGKDTENWKQSLQEQLLPEYQGRAIFLGEVDDATRDKLLNAAYCVVFPSRYESFGLVPLEAFVHGVPVVATRAGAIPEVVEDTISGLLFEAENAGSLAKAVMQILGSREYRARLSAGAKKRIRQFSSRKAAIDALTLYVRLIGNRGSTRKGNIVDSSSDERDTISFMGSHQRLHTEVGSREGRYMKTTGKEGYLMYGPYVELCRGRYCANLFGIATTPGSPVAFAEIVINSGSKRLTTCSLKGINNYSRLASMNFFLVEKSQIEIRVWVAADAHIEISAVTFSPM